MLVSLGVAWGSVLYAIQRQLLHAQGSTLLAWFLIAPVCVWFCFLGIRSAWRALRASYQAKREQTRAQETERQNAAKITQARQEDRRFDGVIAIQSQLILPAQAYMQDFPAALADNANTVMPTEIEYEGDSYMIGARKLAQLPNADELDVYLLRTRRVAGLIRMVLAQFHEPSTGALNTLAESVRAFDMEHPVQTGIRPYWEKENTPAPPSLTVRLLHGFSLTDDAQALQQTLAASLAELDLPPRLHVTVETRAADGADALAQLDAIIEATRNEPSRAWILMAADSQFDDDFLRQAMESTRSTDPASWQQRSHYAPSEGAAGLFLASPALAAALKLPPCGYLKRPVFAVSETEQVSEQSLLREALLRSATDFDALPPPAETIWLEGEKPEKGLIQAAQEINRQAPHAAVESLLPQKQEQEKSGAQESPTAAAPEIQALRRVFGTLGAVNALGLIGASLQAPSLCDLVLAGDSKRMSALVITETPPLPSAPA